MTGRLGSALKQLQVDLKEGQISQAEYDELIALLGEEIAPIDGEVVLGSVDDGKPEHRTPVTTLEGMLHEQKTAARGQRSEMEKAMDSAVKARGIELGINATSGEKK